MAASLWRRLGGWLRGQSSTAGYAADNHRWVVLDCETSGLNPLRDHLLAIAAVAVQPDWQAGRLHIVPGDSFEVVVERTAHGEHDRGNILLHGIGVQAQAQGVPLRQALQDWLAWLGAAPVLAFHSGFDEALVLRHCKLADVPKPPNPWVDIEHLCEVTHERILAKTLDDWMAHFDIRCAQRHQAAADAYAEAELLQRIWPDIARQAQSFADVHRLAEIRQWLARP
jgi:DNA polymerase III subunit epsilon